MELIGMQEIKPKNHLECLRSELYAVMDLLSKMISDMRHEKYQYKESLNDMDKKIKAIEKTVAKGHKQLEKLEKLDKKRDPACDYGMKHMPKKGKKS